MLVQPVPAGHLEIIFEINRRHLDEVRAKFPDDPERVARMSIIDERGQRFVRMAHLAAVGSHAINGVAALHTELLKSHILRDFHDFSPEKFGNKTNGVTPRRWMVLSNPRLTDALNARMGHGWIHDLDRLPRLETFVDDADFRDLWHQIKQDNKKELAAFIKERLGMTVDPQSMFDVLVKRIHEYKQQHLQVLHVITLQVLHRVPGPGQRGVSGP